MKRIFLTLGLVFIATDAFAASAILPMQAKITNLTTIPVAEAIAFCDERNLECPALRRKYEQEREQNAFDQKLEEKNDTVEIAGQDEDILRLSEVGYYIE